MEGEKRRWSSACGDDGYRPCKPRGGRPEAGGTRRPPAPLAAAGPGR